MRFRSNHVENCAKGDARWPEEISTENGKVLLQDIVDTKELKEEVKKRENDIFVLDPYTGAYIFTNDNSVWLCQTARPGGQWRP
jgi:hypothetical protein